MLLTVEDFASEGRTWMGKEAPAGTTSPGCTTLAATLASELGVHMPVKDCGADAKSACPPPRGARRGAGARTSQGALPDAWDTRWKAVGEGWCRACAVSHAAALEPCPAAGLTRPARAPPGTFRRRRAQPQPCHAGFAMQGLGRVVGRAAGARGSSWAGGWC